MVVARYFWIAALLPLEFLSRFCWSCWILYWYLQWKQSQDLADLNEKSLGPPTHITRTVTWKQHSKLNSDWSWLISKLQRHLNKVENCHQNGIITGLNSGSGSRIRMAAELEIDLINNQDRNLGSRFNVIDNVVENQDWNGSRSQSRFWICWDF